jgi:diguanylate cyclase (GGDEF)-like protein
MKIIACSLVLAGTICLLYSLSAVGCIFKKMPKGINRSAWLALFILILVFIISYQLFLLYFFDEMLSTSDLLVPIILFLGGVFVAGVTTLAARSADDIKRLCLLEHENAVDPLLGLYNRRVMDKLIAQEIKKTVRYNLALSVLMIDIDLFKNVNDTFGHQVGDKVLQAVASTIKISVRDIDIIFRYGGEEILVLLPNTSNLHAEHTAERLRTAVENCDVFAGTGVPQKQRYSVTISVGGCSFAAAGGEQNKMIGLADDALYRAKRNGRNRVVIHSNTD